MLSSSRKIGELPSELQILAFKRAIEQNRAVNNETTINSAFNWFETEEGRDFWSSINARQIPIPEKFFKKKVLRLKFDLCQVDH